MLIVNVVAAAGVEQAFQFCVPIDVRACRVVVVNLHRYDVVALHHGVGA